MPIKPPPIKKRKALAIEIIKFVLADMDVPCSSCLPICRRKDLEIFSVWLLCCPAT